MKKIKQPGENISLKTKKNESPEVMDWINGQSNLMDSIRYLVENEIRANGVRNLQLFIPAERGILVAGTAGGGAAYAASAGLTAPTELAAAAGEASAAAGEAAAAAEVEIEQNRYADAEEEGEEGGIADAASAGGIGEEGDVADAASAGVDLEGDDIDDDDIDSWM
ncbi:hypothetical protein ACTHPH_05610 [Paenibacillus pasadenensis]|uniref:Uncharacterized protein n=1 Tax=Paenibacillus pasadenensis TaxID=217090 RepID=A0A2N5ND28_9BACL|nr:MULTISPECIES: hypothetical protein [Paenibacillus]PLT48233.1 hypothetical protein B8V81_0365 [Paenibacillus pasadenensis]